MATTATLNGGATGGLHATPSLGISSSSHSDNPPQQEETCRVESNSSFESGGGNDEGNLHSGGNNNEGGEDPLSSNNNASGGQPNAKGGNNNYFMDFSEASSKKRRKQSRPVRIPLDAEAGGGGDPSSIPTTTASTPPSNRGTLKDPNSSQSKGGWPLLPLNLSGRENNNSSSEDEQNIKRSSLSPNSENEKTDDNVSLSGGLQQQGTNNNDDKRGGPSIPPSFSPGLFPLSSSSGPFSSLFPPNLSAIFQQGGQGQGQGACPPALTPTSSSSTGSSGGVVQGSAMNTLQNLPPHRIFNPEAYCDLCNKEFCNKYFLKTHKANKHGVYTEMSSPSLGGIGQVLAGGNGNGGGPSITTPISTSSFLPILSSAVMGANASTNSNATGGQGSVPGTSSSSSSLPKPPGDLSYPLGSPFTMDNIKSGGGGGGGSQGSNGSQGRESFCDLCQKEFCNKYFLKRHKAKIHGIPVDSSSSSSSGGRGGGSGSKRPFSNGGADPRAFSFIRDMKLENLSNLEIVAKHIEEANYRNQEGIMMNMNIREEGELFRDEDGNKGVCQADSSENVGGGGDPSSSEDPFGLTRNSAENCQFCFREFTSKQHLINHLVKKHRLLIPPTFPPFLFPFPGLGGFPNTTTSPGGQGEEGQGDGQEGGQGLMLGTMNLLDNNGNSTTIDGDYECSLCNRSFQTIYLLRMHKSYFHPDISQEANLGDDEDPDNKFSASGAGAMRENKEEDNEDDDDEDGEDDDHQEQSTGGKTSPNQDDNNTTTPKAKRGHGSKERRGGLATMSMAELEGTLKANSADSNNDSDDLRRLQTMIMELNRVSASAASAAGWGDPSQLAGGLPTGGNIPPTLCHICNKEFYSTYFLQQHIQHFHQGTSAKDNPPEGKSASQSPLPQEPSERKQEGMVRVKQERIGDGGITLSPETLKERLLAAGGDTLALGPEGPLLHPTISSSGSFLTPGPKLPLSTSSTSISGLSSNPSGNNGNNGAKAGEGAKRPSPSLSRSYCTICHKELCNKYFMRTHMLKMHGISIESSTGLGGVTCDICNKELCSKYFLKVHKQNTHGIVEDGPSPPNPSTPSNNNNNNIASPGPISFPSSLNLTSKSPSPLIGQGQPDGGTSSPPNAANADPSLLPKDSGDLVGNRYFSHYSEVCPFCGRRFRSPKWLKSHLQQDHGEEGKERWKSIERSLRRSQQNKGSSSSSSSKGGPGGSLYPFSKGPFSTSSSSSSRRGDGNKCAFCSFSTSDVEIMKGHLLKEHSSQLARQNILNEDHHHLHPHSQQSPILLDPLTLLFQKMEGGTGKMYKCSYCPFTTSILVYLYAHERTHAGLSSTSPSPLGGNSHEGGPSSSSSPAFQCPMCFHGFDSPETFQQHLIGHQMSGVLAPFFTPSNPAATNSRLGFLTSPPGGGGSGGGGDFTLPLLNGSHGENLYWALKNPNISSNTNQDEEEEEEDDHRGNRHGRQVVQGKKGKKRSHSHSQSEERKRGKVPSFRCSYCRATFPSREQALAHVHQEHGKDPLPGKKKRKAKGERKHFKCRKCKFSSTTYQTLLVHCKLQHPASRPQLHGKGSLKLGLPVAQEDGPFLIQGFLMTEDENSNHFVPSVVYLPVREKVSQSIRVSFSLTPTPQQQQEQEKQLQPSKLE